MKYLSPLSADGPVTTPRLRIRLTSNLLRSYTAAGTVKLNIDVCDILISIDLAAPCGLIINELAPNSLKYAFQGGRTGTATVAMCRDGSDYVLSARDDGTAYTGRLVDRK
jgi:two-component sensor histidine kinase